MGTLGLTDEEVDILLRAGRRLLINESTQPDDLRAVLVKRLRNERPGLAAKLERMQQADMSALCETMLVQGQSHA